jgi:hypothetical protein
MIIHLSTFPDKESEKSSEIKKSLKVPPPEGFREAT